MSNRLSKVAKRLLYECEFDRKKHRTTDPRANSDRLYVSAALAAQLHDAVKDMPKETQGLPFTVEQVERRKDKDGFIKAVLSFSLEDLSVGMDCLNDVVAEAILSDMTGLEDIAYRPVGIANDEVLVEVTGDVKEWLKRVNSSEEEEP